MAGVVFGIETGAVKERGKMDCGRVAVEYDRTDGTMARSSALMGARSLGCNIVVFSFGN